MTQRSAPDNRFHAPSLMRYSENMARVGCHIGASSESGITLDNSVKGLALSYIEDKVVAYQEKKEQDQSYAIIS